MMTMVMVVVVVVMMAGGIPFLPLFQNFVTDLSYTLLNF